MFNHGKFEEILKEKGITAYRVSKETGVATATLTGWKNGNYTPKYDKISKIALYLGVSVEELEGDDDYGNTIP